MCFLLQADQEFVTSLANVASSVMSKLACLPLCTKEESKQTLTTLRKSINEIYSNATTTDETPTEDAQNEEDTSTEDETDEAKKLLLEETKALVTEIKDTKSNLEKLTASLLAEEQVFDKIKACVSDNKEKIFAYLKRETNPSPLTQKLIRTAMDLIRKLLKSSRQVSQWPRLPRRSGLRYEAFVELHQIRHSGISADIPGIVLTLPGFRSFHLETNKNCSHITQRNPSDITHTSGSSVSSLYQTSTP